MLGRPRHNPSAEARASAPAGTLKLHLHRIAPLQGRVMRAKPERARVSRAEKRKAARTPRLAEARASAPAGTLKLHFRKARLQDRVPKNDELTGISHKQREHQFPLFDSASIGISITKRNFRPLREWHGGCGKHFIRGKLWLVRKIVAKSVTR